MFVRFFLKNETYTNFKDNMEMSHIITLGLSVVGIAASWGSLNTRLAAMERGLDPKLGERLASLEAKMDILLGLKAKE